MNARLNKHLYFGSLGRANELRHGHDQVLSFGGATEGIPVSVEVLCLLF